MYIYMYVYLHITHLVEECAVFSDGGVGVLVEHLYIHVDIYREI